MIKKVLHCTNFYLLLIIIFSLASRLWGVNYGLPLTLHMDENPNLSMGYQFIKNGSLNPALTDWGFVRSSFIFYLLAIITYFYLLLGNVFSWSSSISTLNVPLEFPNLLLVGRITSAILGTFAVYLTFLIARSIFNKKIALLSALFLGTTFIHIVVSHYATSDVPQGVFQLISFYFLYKIIKHGQLRDYLLSGLFIGLAISCNYHAAWSIANLVVAHFLHVYPEKFNFGKLINKANYLFVGLIFVPIGFLIITPYALIEFQRFFSDISFMKNVYRSGQNAVFASSLNGIPTPVWWLVYLFTSGLGPAHLLLFFIGVIVCLFKPNKTNLFLLSFPLIWFLFMSTNIVRFDRHITAILPMMAIIASVGFIQITERLLKKKLLAIVFLLFVFTPVVYKIVIFDYLIAGKDTRQLAIDWAIKNLDKESLILTTGATIPVGQKLNEFGFTNIVNVNPNDPEKIFSYPGEIFLTGDEMYRTAKLYQNTSVYKPYWENYNLIYQKGDLLKQISQTLFQKEFFGPFFLEESSTVNIYHNPAIMFFKIPKIEKYATGKVDFQYLPSQMSTNLSLEKKDGQDILISDGTKAIGISGPHKPFQKGNYVLTYVLDITDCGAPSNKITLRVISSGGSNEYANKVYDCSSVFKMKKLTLPFQLTKTNRLEIVFLGDPGIKLSIHNATVNN